MHDKPWPRCLKVEVSLSTKDKPLNLQYQHACSPCCSPYISYDTSWENLINHQGALVIISSILMTCMFDELVTL